MTYQFETPFFLLKEKIMRENIKGFQSALDELWPNSLIAYSIKTNALPWILSWMNDHGVYAEAVSDEEYQLAQLSGFSADHIVFNGPIKSDTYLRRALQEGSIVNIDSKRELNYLTSKKLNTPLNLGIRVNVNPALFDGGSDIGFMEDGFRFGFSVENGDFSKAVNEIKKAYGDIRLGLHMHVNSITRSVNVYKTIARFAAFIIEKYINNPSFIDIGGGFFGGVPGKPSPAEYIVEIKKELEQTVDTRAVKLIIEPGSAAIGSAIELHTSVTDVKDTACARIITTDGSRIFIDPLWKKKTYMHSTDSEKEPFARQIVCGYTCMDHDRIMTLENEPELSEGDHIVYHRVGNYTVTFGGPFIKPVPPVYVENENGRTLIRKRMTAEDIYRLETGSDSPGEVI